MESACGYCNGEKVEISHTHTTKLFMDTFKDAHVLITECMPCPPCSECCMNGVPSNSAFIINNCPMCGRKLP